MMLVVVYVLYMRPFYCYQRLWDVETGKEVLLQDGHAKEVRHHAFDSYDTHTYIYRVM